MKIPIDRITKAVKPKSLKSRITIWAGVFLLLTGVVGAGYWYTRAPAASAGFVYDQAELTRGNIRRAVATSGPVRSLVTVSVGSQLSGQIKELKVDYNSEVKAGDILALIDDSTFASRVNQATADLAMARATVKVQEAALVKANAELSQAKRALARAEQLAGKGISSVSMR